jgi:SAM-dependent methyltransferase
MIKEDSFFSTYVRRISKIQRLSDSDLLTAPRLVEDHIGKLQEYLMLRDKIFLDPACGRGSYLVKEYDILFDFYSEIKDIEKRNFKVINSIIGIDKERYYVDISKQSLRDAQKFRGVKNIIDPLVFQKDFLTEKIIGMKFDAIVGNPPFNGPYENSNSYWKKFIKRSKELLNPGGYLSFVTPNGWLYDNKVKPIISSMNLVYADLDRKSDFSEAGQNIGSTITFFIAENSTCLLYTSDAADEG